MNVILSALLVASSLNSEIGTFFTLPEWMPRSVSSQDTIGSDPEGEEGWYVNYEETKTIKEIVFVGWEITRDGLLVQGLPDPWWDINLWNISKCFVKEDMNQNRDIWAGGEDPPLIWYCYDRNNPKIITHVYRGNIIYATNETDVVVTNWIPRAARITPEILSSLNASFEAYFERQYFALQGKRNSWPESIYGPTDDLRKFWFDPLGFNYEYVYGTNRQQRIIYTRRLDEFERASGLCSFLRDSLAKSGFTLIGEMRPGWIDPTDGYSPLGWWSTTSGCLYDKEDIVPEFPWTKDPTTPFADQWKGCSQCFANLNFDDAWTIPNDAKSYVEKPLKKMMEKLWFGQSVTEYDIHKVDTGVREESMAGLISNVYPHADGFAITNVTRRLMSDAMCCANQVLGLMDRTYYEPKIHYSTIGTNYLFENSCSCKGKIYGLSCKWDGLFNLFIIEDPTNILWENGFTYTNSQQVAEVSSEPTGVHRRITNTRGGVEFILPVKEPMSIPTNELFVEKIVNQIAPNFSGEFRLFVSTEVFKNSSGNLGSTCAIEIDGTLYYDSIAWLSPAEYISGKNIDVIFTYTRSYEYAHSKGMFVEKIQGMGDTDGRLGLQKYGGVTGRCVDTNCATAVLDNWMYDASTCFTRYESHSSDFSGIESLNRILKNKDDELETLFSAKYGENPKNWEKIIRIDENAARKARDKSKVTGLTVPTFSNYGTMYEVVGIKNGSSVTITSFDSVTREGKKVKGLVPFIKCDLEYYVEQDLSDTVERPGLAEDDRIGIMTRTDWNWKALKRIDE